MGLKFKVDGKEVDSKSYHYDGGNPPQQEPAEIQMTPDMTERLWEVINENTELKQQLYMAEHRLEQIKRIVAE